MDGFARFLWKLVKHFEIKSDYIICKWYWEEKPTALPFTQSVDSGFNCNWIVMSTKSFGVVFRKTLVRHCGTVTIQLGIGKLGVKMRSRNSMRQILDCHVR